MRLFLSLVFFHLSIFSFGQIANKADNTDLDSLFMAKEKKSIGKPFPKFVAADVESKITNDSLMGNQYQSIFGLKVVILVMLSLML